METLTKPVRGRPKDRRFPFADLDELIQLRVATSGFHGPTPGLKTILPHELRMAYYRARRSGFVPLLKADEFAITLGVNPSDIWANWYSV